MRGGNRLFVAHDLQANEEQVYDTIGSHKVDGIGFCIGNGNGAT
jgi:hypothetical protein